ncbi:MAG: peptide-methionine (R)-S-oxide reductase MsrB [Pirellulaceae bacterium]
MIRKLWPLSVAGLFLLGCGTATSVDVAQQHDELDPSSTSTMNNTDFNSESEYQPKTDAEWRELLTRDQYYVTREHGTEPRGSSPYNHLKDEGVFRCVCCGQTLFASEDKYESGTGWPSFIRPIDKDHVGTKADNTFFMRRTEVHCSRCQAHLGHVFPDGPQPTGMRYCMNGVALQFEKSPPTPPANSSSTSDEPAPSDDSL